MENDLKSDVTSQQSAEQTPAGPSVDYVPAAPLIEVLFEQLEYLAAHLTNGEDCPSACPLCARLDQVSRSLLSPFSGPFHEV